MEQSETKKTYRYAALVTYVIALVCLLLGFFVPFFNGKQILALQLPDVFNAIIGKDLLKFGKPFEVFFNIYFLGINKEVNVMAWVVLVYFAITLAGFIGLIPVIIGTVKTRFLKAASVAAYIVETAAVLVLSVYLLLGLQMVPEVKIFYNLLIPFGGCLLTLIVLNCINKKASGAVKTILLLLSCITFLMLFDYLTANAKIGNLLEKVGGKIKVSPLFFSVEGQPMTGVDFLSLLFASPKGYLKETFSMLPDAKTKALFALAIITATIALLNFFADVIGLSTNAKFVGRLFNIARYLVELLAVVCMFITLAVCKYYIGILLIIISFVAAIQLLINIILLVVYLLKHRTKKEKTEKEPKPAKIKPEKSKPEKKKKEESYGIAPAPAPAPTPASMFASEPEEAQRDDSILNPYIVSPPPTTEYSQKNPYRITTDEPPAPKYAQPQQYNPAPAPKPEPRPEPPKYTGTLSYEPVQEPAPAPKPAEPAYPTYNPNPVPPVQQEPPVVEQTRVYKVNTLYQGPTDDFMKKLTNDEKVEFSMAFIERSKGEIGNVPDYVIGGDNRKFFSAVFIYLGKIRGIVSDNLLNKMYKELNML